MGALLVIMFVVFVAIGVPISFALGFISFVGINAMDTIPNTVVFTKMFNGMTSFTLLAVPLFILAANLMNEGEITGKLIDCCNALVGRFRGGLAYSNVLVSMIFAGISGSSQADTAGIGSILIPAMENTGYDKGTSVGVTAASSTLGSIIPPSITMVVYAGIANVSTGALFMSGLVPGILLGLAQMSVIKYYSKRKNFPKMDPVPINEVVRLTLTSLPALMTPIILIGGIVLGFFTPTESAAIACIYALRDHEAVLPVLVRTGDRECAGRAAELLSSERDRAAVLCQHAGRTSCLPACDGGILHVCRYVHGCGAGNDPVRPDHPAVRYVSGHQPDHPGPDHHRHPGARPGDAALRTVPADRFFHQRNHH